MSGNLVVGGLLRTSSASRASRTSRASRASRSSEGRTLRRGGMSGKLLLPRKEMIRPFGVCERRDTLPGRCWCMQRHSCTGTDAWRGGGGGGGGGVTVPWKEVSRLLVKEAVLWCMRYLHKQTGHRRRSLTKRGTGTCKDTSKIYSYGHENEFEMQGR